MPKSLELKQVEIEMTSGHMRLLVNRWIEGEKLTPHLIGIMPGEDPAVVLAANRAALEAEGYPWFSEAMEKRALALRDMVLVENKGEGAA